MTDMSLSLDPRIAVEAEVVDNFSGGGIGRKLFVEAVGELCLLYSREKHMASGTHRPQSSSRNPYLQ